jgi:carbon monoxide dehydrogenase subunit G
MELTNEFRVGVPLQEAWTLLTDVERIAPCMPGAELQEIEGDEYRGIVKVKVGPITAQYKGKATFIERDESGGKAVLRAEGRDTRGQGNANATITAALISDGAGTKVTVTTDLTVTGRVAQFGRGVLAEVSAKLLNQFVECLEDKVLGGEVPAGGGAATDEPTRGGAAAAGVGSVGTPPVGPGSAPAASTTATSSGSAEASAAGSVGVATAESASANGSGTSPGGTASASTEEPTIRRIQSAPAEPVDLFQHAGGSIGKRLAPVVATVLAVLFILRRRRRRRRR